VSNIKSYIKGVGSGYINMLVINVVGLLLTPFILKYVTREEFAFYYVAADLLMWLSLAQLGVSNSYNSYAAQMFGAGKLKELSFLSSSAWGLQILSALTVIIVGFVLSFFVADFFEVDKSIKHVQLFFILLVIASAFTIVNQIYSALLVSAKEIHISNRISIISVVPKVILTVILIFAGWKLVGLALANLLAIIVPILISIFYVRKHFPDIKISLKYWSKEYNKKLLVSGLWFTLGGVAGILILGLDRIVIAKVVSLEIVASFLITQKLFFLSDKIFSQILNVSRPFFGQLYGKGSYQMMYNLYKFFTKFSIFLAVIAASFILLINEFFIKIWVGSELYAGEAISFWLAINFIVQFILLPNRVVLATTLHRLKWQNSLRVVEGVVNLSLSILLGKQFGIPGVILGSVISSLLFSNLIFNYYCDEFFRIHNIKLDNKIYFHYLMILLLILTYLLNIQLNVVLFKLIAIPFIAIFSVFYLKLLLNQSNKEGLLDNLQLPKYLTYFLKSIKNE